MEIVFEKGSLSELITGKKVDNKEKVVIRYEKLEPKENTQAKTPKHTDEIVPKSDDQVEPIKKSKKSKNKKKVSTSSKDQNANVAETVKNEETKNEKDSNEKIIKQKDDKGNRKQKKEKAKKFKELREKKEELSNNPEELARTIFVGNVPLTTTKIKFKKFFSKYGKVESVRFRCPPIKNINSSKKVTVIKGDYHPERTSWISYVKFQTEEDAKKALESNGEIYKDHHLRVSSCSKTTEKHDESKAIFIGNLALNTEDDQLWQAFESCGQIESVRIVRDSSTGMGKGFAFINFASSDSVQLALQMEDIKINKKVIRIQPCNTKAAKKNKKNNFSKVIKPKKPKKKNNEHDNDIEKSKKRKREDGDSIEVEKSKKMKKISNENMATSSDQQFTGTKIDIKKKKKKDKGLKKKEILAKKLLASK